MVLKLLAKVRVSEILKRGEEKGVVDRAKSRPFEYFPCRRLEEEDDDESQGRASELASELASSNRPVGLRLSRHYGLVGSYHVTIPPYRALLWAKGLGEANEQASVTIEDRRDWVIR